MGENIFKECRIVIIWCINSQRFVLCFNVNYDFRTNNFRISKAKLLLKRIPTPARALEKLLKYSCVPLFRYPMCLILLSTVSFLKKMDRAFFFVLSHRKVSRLFVMFAKPLAFKKQMTNSLVELLKVPSWYLYR